MSDVWREEQIELILQHRQHHRIRTCSPHAHLDTVPVSPKHNLSHSLLTSPPMINYFWPGQTCEDFFHGQGRLGGQWKDLIDWFGL